MINPDGTVTYTPNAGFSGEGSFGYTACDSGGACDTATVTVTVEAVSACMPEGTDAGETITGTPGPDVICAYGGNDTIFGRGGDDVILGGSGDDTIEGGAGNDELYGEDGHDRLIGGAGADHLDGGPNAFVPLSRRLARPQHR